MERQGKKLFQNEQIVEKNYKLFRIENKKEIR